VVEESNTRLCLAIPPVKNVVLTGFGKITLLDLDTIDISNLNRQFLFKKKDVKQSKALVRSWCSISYRFPSFGLVFNFIGDMIKYS
jgi:hypothetical protein